MLRFSELRTVDTDERKQGRVVKELTEPLIVHLELDGRAVPLWHIQRGYRSDGSSFPWWVRWKWTPWGRYGSAGVLHDYLLEHWTSEKKWAVDMIYYHALKSCGVSDLEAFIMWMAVRTKSTRD